MKGMILAAGFGTRLRPATFLMPKPIVPLCNRPLIGYSVDALVRASVHEIAVNLHYLPEEIETYLLFEFGDCCSFEFSQEESILGTGGAIRKLRPFLEDGDAFFLLNGDTVQFPTLDSLRHRREEAGAVSALLLRHPPGDDRFTPVHFENGLVTGIGEGHGESLMFCGAHCISPRIFNHFPDRDFFGVTEDVYIPLLQGRQERIAGLVSDGPWFDIGTPLRYLSATDVVRELMMTGRASLPLGTAADPATRSLIHESAVVEGEASRSVIGATSRLMPGASMTHSVVWRRSEIGRDAVIRNSIIGDGLSIPGGSRLENAFVCRSLPGAEYAPGSIERDSMVCVPIDPGTPWCFDL